MKIRYLIFLLATSLGGFCQTLNLPLRQDIQGYRGNRITSLPLTLSPSDTLLTLTVKGYHSETSKTLVTPQPQLIRTGLSVTVQYPNPGPSEQLSFYELYAGGQVRFYGYVNVSKTGIVNPGISNQVLSGLNSQLGILQSQIAALSVTVGNPFTRAAADGLYKPLGYAPSWAEVTGKPGLFSGSYTDLANKPTLFSGSYADLTNRPALFSGAYSDLSGKPAIPTSASQVGAYTTAQADNAITSATAPISASIAANAVAIDKRVGYVADIPALVSFARGNLTSVVVADPVRGGQFTYFASGYTVDNGIVFGAVGGGFWVRQYNGPVRDVWFGTTGDITTLATIISLYDDILLSAIAYTGTLTISRNGLKLTGQKPTYNGTTLTGGTILNGNIVVTGNYNTINAVGLINGSGNGITVRDNASYNLIQSCLFLVQNHGILIEQYGGTATDNKAKDCITYNGTHGFVSKANNTTFENPTSYNPSSEGIALVSDNITGAGLNSQCIGNVVINPQVFGGSFGIKIYTRDYFSTTNTAGLLLRNVSITGGNIRSMASYGILVGDDLATPPAGQTYNEVKNISILGTAISDMIGPWAIKFGRCDGVVVGQTNIVGAFDKSLTLAKNVITPPNTVAGGSLGNVVYNYILPVNTDGPSVAFGDGYFETANTATTTLTNLAGGKIGKVVTIVLGDDFTTVAKSGQFALANYVRGKGSVVVLKYKNDGSGWQEIFSRSTANVQFYNYNTDLSIDPANGRLAVAYLTGNVTSLTFVTPQKNSDFRLVLGANGTYTLAGWDSRIVWLTGGAPTRITTGTRTVLDFYYDGTSLLNIGKSGTDFQSSKAYTPAAIPTGTEVTTTVTVPGATLGKMAVGSFSSDLLGCKITAYVSATDTVTITIRNDTGSPQTPAPGTLFARVLN